MREFENHIHWKAVKEVCHKLREKGFSALLAGGCVRDLLMSREPHDFDVATDATPDDVEKIFPNAVMVGKAFGVSIIPFQGFQVEVATFREDLEYKDGRRPEGVRFSTPQADAKRRDFTVNALFYDLDTRKVIDFVSGEADIKKKIIRTVGAPDARFGEDKLRIVRAIRFAAQLGFQIESATLEAVIRLSPEVSVVSRERVRDEMRKLLKSHGRVVGLELLLSTGLMKVLFEELAPLVFASQAEWFKRFAIMGALIQERQIEAESDFVFSVSLALFFLPVWTGNAGKQEIRDKFLKNLRLDNHQINEILFVLESQQSFLAPDQVRRGEMQLLLLHPCSRAALLFASVLERAAAGSLDSKLTKREAFLAGFSVDKPEPFLSGDDLRDTGIQPGPKMGQLLHEAYCLQLEDALKDRLSALQWLKKQT